MAPEPNRKPNWKWIGAAIAVVAAIVAYHSHDYGEVAWDWWHGASVSQSNDLALAELSWAVSAAICAWLWPRTQQLMRSVAAIIAGSGITALNVTAFRLDFRPAFLGLGCADNSACLQGDAGWPLYARYWIAVGVVLIVAGILGLALPNRTDQS